MVAKYPPDPIWLGSSTKQEFVTVKPIREVVPPEMHSDEFVIVIDHLETHAVRCERAKKYVQAAECLEQAINKRLGFLGERHPELLLAIERHVYLCNYWGIQCLQTREYSASLELLKKAQAMTEAEIVPSFKRRIYLRAVTFNNLCCYFHARGKLNAALQCVDRALKIEQRYKDNKNTALMHLNMGVLLSFMMRSEEAIQHSECAVAFLAEQENIMLHEHGREGIHDEGADPALKARYRDIVSSLTVAYHNTGVELTRVGRHEEALDFLTHAFQVGERKLGPEHPSTIAAKKSFAVTVKAHPPAPPARSPQRKGSTGGGYSHASLPQPGGLQAIPAMVMNDEKDSKAATASSFQVEQVSPEAIETLPDIRIPNSAPKSARPPRQRKSFREMRTMEQIKGRGVNMFVPPKLLKIRPRLKDSTAPDSHVGSPIIQQCVHGITPLSDFRSTLNSTDGFRGHMQSSHSSAKAQKKSPRKKSLPANGEILDTAIGTELRQKHELPDGFSLPQIIDKYKQEAMLDNGDIVKPTDHRFQAIAAMKRHFQDSNPGSLGVSMTSQQEDVRSAVSAPVDATRGLAIQYVSTAKPVLVRDEAAVFIQRIARGFIVRRRILKEVEKVANRSATRIQRLFRKIRNTRTATSAA